MYSFEFPKTGKNWTQSEEIFFEKWQIPENQSTS